MAESIYAGDAGFFKTCSRCDEVHHIHGFARDARTSTGRGALCAECNRRHVNAYRSDNEELVKEKKRAARATDPVRAREIDAIARAKAGEKRRARERARYWRNREDVLASRSSDAGREYARIRQSIKLLDPAERLYSNVSRAIRASIKDKSKRGWEAVVGYTIETLVSHLERQFTPGMTWQNHGKGDGKWHVDHIVPKSSFSFRTSECPEFKACWSLSNLRPLWGTENISKGAKMVYLL